MSSTTISLGWNCSSATRAVDLGIRLRKIDGYKTCPFDECLTNYEGIKICLYENFENFLNPEYLGIFPAKFSTGNVKMGERLIFNTRYNFIFNHESPGHSDLFLTQKWSGGIDHYIKDDFNLFKNRYIKRITNFRDYLENGPIKFVITRFSSDLSGLDSIIKKAYPKLSYELIHFSPTDDRAHVLSHHRLMGLSENTQI